MLGILSVTKKNPDFPNLLLLFFAKTDSKIDKKKYAHAKANNTDSIEFQMDLQV